VLICLRRTETHWQADPQHHERVPQRTAWPYMENQ